jgi:mycothiol synthase
LQLPRLDRLMVRGIVTPALRRRGIGTLLMKRAIGRAQELTSARPIVVDMSVREPISGAAELAQSLGFQPVRHFCYMERGDLTSLPEPRFPEGIELREYTLGQDEEEFVAAYSEAFADHWGFVPHTLQQEQHRVGAPHFRTENNLLAVTKDDQIVGLCLLEFSEAEQGSQLPDFPVIDDLAVRPAYRRRGIGRALMLSGMRRVAERGYRAIGLAVDVQNPNEALRFYESLGFMAKWGGTVYRKELR